MQKLEIPVKNVTVSLYSSEEDARNETNSIAKKKTGASGAYTFTKLKNGTYYLKYSIPRDKYTISNIESSEFNGSGIVPVQVSNQQLLVSNTINNGSLANIDAESNTICLKKWKR